MVFVCTFWEKGTGKLLNINNQEREEKMILSAVAHRVMEAFYRSILQFVAMCFSNGSLSPTLTVKAVYSFIIQFIL